MTEQSNAELVATARSLIEQYDPAFAFVLKQVTDRLEAAEKGWDADVERLAEAHNARIAADRRAERAEAERDRLDEAFDRDLPWRYDEVEAQRNQYAAVVEQVREFCEDIPGVFRFEAGRILDLLATSPEDALREVKADVWDEGYGDCITYHQSHGLKGRETNPYREERA